MSCPALQACVGGACVCQCPAGTTCVNGACETGCSQEEVVSGACACRGVLCTTPGELCFFGSCVPGFEGRGAFEQESSGALQQTGGGYVNSSRLSAVGGNAASSGGGYVHRGGLSVLGGAAP